MSQRTRLKRPAPEREQPIRNFTHAIGLGVGATGGAPESDGDAAAPVSRAVELGYRVVDEYIRQGQKAARRVGAAPAGPDAAVGDMQELASRLAQFTSEWVGIWLDFAQRVAPGLGGFPPAPGRAAPATPAAAAPSAAAPTSTAATAPVRIALSAAGPVEVSLDLQPDAAARPLIVHTLRAVAPKLPRLTDVQFTPATDDAPGVLAIRVPATHPPGVYSGAIVDAESDRPVGTLCVEVLRPST